MKPFVSFEQISQVFSRPDGSSLMALKDVSFDIGRHEFVAVVGPSGCGKSTLLRLLSGLLMPTRGQVTLFGQPVTEPRDEVGIVFQKPTLLPWLNALENVVFPVRHKTGRVARADYERARELIAMVGLGDFCDRMPGELSGGMQQRLGIARALLLDPDVLLMDEPFSALDALSREEMGFELLRIWNERPKTVLFITHSITEAVLLSDRVLVMSERPGTLVSNIAIDLPRPRTVASIQEKRFHEYSSQIRDLIYRPHHAA
ncbi:MAG: ABC transporter ATP-binding protein [Oceanospirillaceae bacterium]|nr:ABC transporter ATP-binding protein [Oceanospirillaceae bacterium]